MIKLIFQKLFLITLFILLFVPVSYAMSPEEMQNKAIQSIEKDIRELKITMDSVWRYVCKPTHKECKQNMAKLRRALEQAELDLDGIQRVEAAEKARQFARPGSKPNHFLIPRTNIYLPSIGSDKVYVLECFSSGYNKRVARNEKEFMEQMAYQRCEEGKGRLVVSIYAVGKKEPISKKQAWDYKTKNRSYKFGP